MNLEPTLVFRTYWEFAAERQMAYYNRLSGKAYPWSEDQILKKYRFTNAYRAADRVSQYLIREVQYNPVRSTRPEDIFLRTLLFKIFNKIDTWEALEIANGKPIELATIDYDLIAKALSERMSRGIPIYSAAYIMPSPKFGFEKKFANHLALIRKMIDDSLPERLRQRPKLSDVYELLLSYSGLGPFLAFQFTIDLNYSSFLNFDENEFVVAGPGAIDGLSKCFNNYRDFRPAEIINYVTTHQNEYLSNYGVDFRTLFGRELKPIDCQNLFCEISKYARVAHPDVQGVSGRTRIKQSYRQAEKRLPEPYFPDRWGINKSASKFMAKNSTHSDLRLL